ncbi:hypothetical protein EC973_005804 [Apophysomyces ossiformis]|uniref:Uncharacterized protein n=1 Tax=Apophysomyces ossiformis TaxID=679940 RepID=A0A8H7ERC7_9FUNG|nr:hypothetical protein EC973_005804 [Apophysomyces ossiformis]
MANEPLLATTFTNHLLATITTLQEQLAQLEYEHNQLTQAITKTSDASVTDAEMASMKTTMAQVSLYHTKLLSLRSSMSMLLARSKQLQKRADQLKATKLQYLSQVDHIKRMEQERDQAIVARVVHSPAETEIADTVSAKSITSDTDTPASPASTTVIKKIATKQKKKKKVKVREVEIGDESTPGWELKPSLSQQDLTRTKRP